MADRISKEVRSYIMRKVKSNHNKSTELFLIHIFKEHQIKGWRRTYKLFGKPDFVFPQKRVAIFVDGCFWHGHNCRNTKPKQNSEYWEEKIGRNKKRDIEVNMALSFKNWTVIRFWECELKDGERILKILAGSGVCTYKEVVKSDGGNDFV